MNIKTNLTNEELFPIAEQQGGAVHNGVLYTYTGKNTGRSPNAKRIVVDSFTKNKVDWKNNTKISKSDFNVLYSRFLEYKKQQQELFLQEVQAVRDTEYSLNINVWTELACHSAFARNIFIPWEDNNFKADYNIYHFPQMLSKPTVVISFEEKAILISGTLYSGEIKKSIFTVLNYLFPENHEFLPMHCSVNTGVSGDSPAIFFGLSGTGKTTLSSDEKRILVGDDEHGWTDKGLVNFEGGCYAKTIKLSKESEPQIWKACHTPGAIIENAVVVDGAPNFDDSAFTENSRASYPTSFIDNASPSGFINSHPKNIIMLTCDSFGVLPGVARLTPAEAVEQFLLGYTSKVAGTEDGITEPLATFSPCFGLPFMPLPPARYGKLLKKKILEHKVNCWLVNTGWVGGGYGIGKRMPIAVTRNIINCIHNGQLAKAPTKIHEWTKFAVPVVPGNIIPEYVRKPELAWINNNQSLEKYSSASKKLMDLFHDRLGT